MKNFMLKAMYGVGGNLLAMVGGALTQGYQLGGHVSPMVQAIYYALAASIGTGLTAAGKRLLAGPKA